MFLATRLEGLPRSLVGINWLLLVALLGGPRFAYRVYKDRSLDHLLERASHVPIPVLVIGAREDADLFIRTTQRDPARRLSRRRHRSSDSAMRVGRDIGGVPVLGTLDDIAEVVARLVAARRPAAAHHHLRRAGSTAARCAGCSMSPTSSAFRWRGCRASPTSRRRVDDDPPRSSRSRSRICSAGRRPCSTAPA